MGTAVGKAGEIGVKGIEVSRIDCIAYWMAWFGKVEQPLNMQTFSKASVASRPTLKPISIENTVLEMLHVWQCDSIHGHCRLSVAVYFRKIFRQRANNDRPLVLTAQCWALWARNSCKEAVTAPSDIRSPSWTKLLCDRERPHCACDLTITKAIELAALAPHCFQSPNQKQRPLSQGSLPTTAQPSNTASLYLSSS